jgi:hypothetical protein
LLLFFPVVIDIFKRNPAEPYFLFLYTFVSGDIPKEWAIEEHLGRSRRDTLDMSLMTGLEFNRLVADPTGYKYGRRTQRK